MTTGNAAKMSLAKAGTPARERTSLLMIAVDHDTAELVRYFALRVPFLHVESRLTGYHRNGEDTATGENAPDICLLDFDKDRRSAAEMAQHLHARHPATCIFAVSAEAEPAMIIEAMRSGCMEYLRKPVDGDEFLHAVARVAGRQREQKETLAAQVLMLIGAKGGCGTTSLATRLAALLARESSKKTLLVDMHPEFGDAALYLGLGRHQYHSFDLIENSERLDAEFLQSFVVHHSSGLDLIPAPEGRGAAPSHDPWKIVRTLDFLRGAYDYVVVDAPAGMSDENVELVRYADQVYLVTVAEVPALRNVVRLLEFFTQNQVPAEKIRVVLNRYHKRGLITEGEIEKAIRRKLFWKVPNQYAQMVKTVNGGDPLAERSGSEVMRNLSDWASVIGSKQQGEKQDSGIFGFWNR